MSSITGEADRSFRLGLLLEKNGQTRAASAALHTAATLYSCLAESNGGEEFEYVTTLSPSEISTALSYTCVRLAHLSHDALGDPKAAARLYLDAIRLDEAPSAVAYEGVGKSIEASGGSMQEAVKYYKKALELMPNNGKFCFHYAVCLERLGRQEESEEWMNKLRRNEAILSSLIDSWGYVRWHTRKIPDAQNNLQRGTRDMLQIAVDAAMPLIQAVGGERALVCEFGVGNGRSLRMTQELLPLHVPIHGFDTFTGLPQAWGNEPIGTYSTGGRAPSMEGDVIFHKGLFQDTIPQFLAECDNESFLAYANIDCDLYTSTLDILESMHSKIVPGTILVFDEYLCHPTWRQDEFRAWRECCKRFGWQYEYLAFSLETKQTVVKVVNA